MLHRLPLLLTILTIPGAHAKDARDGAPPVKTDGSDLGITIMGAIVKEGHAEDNVALIKESNGTVKAVKQDYVILDKYKVLAVKADRIEVIARDGQRYAVFQDKFAAEIAKSKATQAESAAFAGVTEQFKEEGFERIRGKINMTGIYRDKLVKDDLAKVLMQATAEPYMEGGQIIGFKLSQIDDGSIYNKAGLLDEDIVTGINGQELTSVAGSIKLLQSLKGTEHLEVEVRRGEQTLKYTIDVN